MIVTTLEQSKTLLKLGIAPYTADMYWDYDDMQKYHRINMFEEGFPRVLKMEDIPCWSLTALLNILPYPTLSKDNIGKNKTGWMVSVFTNNGRYDSIWHDNAIDACYEMIIILKKEKLL